MPSWAGPVLLVISAVLLGCSLLLVAGFPGPSRATLAVAPRAAMPTPVPGKPSSAPARAVTAARPTDPAARPRQPRPGTSTQVPQRPLRPQRDLSPTRVVIPALDIDRRLVPLGVLGDGSLEAPRRPADLGWWQDGPPPGTGGNAVIVGHLDSKTGPAVFYGLASLKSGDKVMVTRGDGSTARFRVRGVEQVPVTKFPAERVYRRSGPAGLVLLTCGGVYDRSAGRYVDNVLVFASPVR